MVGNNTGATRQAGEPNDAHLRDGAGSIWYSFKAPHTGFVGFDTAGSEIDAVLAAYRGSLGTGLTQIAQSDPSREVDTIALALKAGQVVKIDVDGEREEDPSTKNAGWTTPAEIADAIAFLASPAAAAVNGQRIALDGRA